MKLYWLKRILFSIFSLVVVILTVSFLIYNVMDRTTILGNDGPYNKKNIMNKLSELMTYMKSMDIFNIVTSHSILLTNMNQFMVQIMVTAQNMKPRWKPLTITKVAHI